MYTVLVNHFTIISSIFNFSTMVKVKRNTRTASSSRSKSDSVCYECNAIIDDAKALQCERCGDREGVWKCQKCLSVSDNFYDELVNLPVNNSFHWFCNKCEKNVLKPNEIRIESVLQMLSQAMDKITNLETIIRSSQISASDFQNKVLNRIELTESKVQLLIDVNIPPTLYDTTFDETQKEDNQQTELKSDGSNEVQTATTVVPLQRTGWSELFHRVSEVAAEVRAVKEATTINQVQPKSVQQQQQQQQSKEDDSIARSVVVYGLPESRGTNDTLLIDHLIKEIDSSLSVESHRRLRKKTTTASTKPPPLLVVLSTVFDRRKLLSLAPNLKQLDQYRSVFIKKALSVSELKEITELREKCAAANEILSQTDPLLETKYLVIDGKIRRLVRLTDSTETNSYKVEWSAIINLSDLPKN